MTRRSLDLLRDVLDHEIVDAEGVSCGMVDYIELSNTAEGPAVTALLVGPGAWLPRLPAWLEWPAERFFGRRIVRIPWDKVAHVGEVIELSATAAALHLGHLDRKAGTWLRHVPKS